MIKLSPVSILGVIVILSGCRTQLEPMPGHIQQVTSYLTGVMETSAQAKAIPDAPSVRMIIGEVKLNDIKIYNYKANEISFNSCFKS